MKKGIAGRVYHVNIDKLEVALDTIEQECKDLRTLISRVKQEKEQK